MAHLWSKTPESVTTDPRLTRTAHRLYQYLDLRAGQRGSWWGPQHEIARELGIHERTVRKALAQLLAGGYIRVERTIEHRTQNIYLVAARASQTGPHGPVGEARTGRSLARRPLSGSTDHATDHATGARAGARAAG